MFTILILLLPLGIPYLFKKKYGYHITSVEYFAHSLIVLVSVISVYLFSNTYFTEDFIIEHGFIVSKEVKRSECRHDAPCNCVKKCDRAGKCLETCQSCKIHANDYTWQFVTSVGNIVLSPRDGDLAQVAPESFNQFKKGDLISSKAKVVNYLKLNRSSLFSDFSHNPPILSYPSALNDFKSTNVLSYKLDFDLYIYQTYMRQLLSKIALKQLNANPILILTGYMDKNQTRELIKSWGGGKLNDIIVVVSFSGTSNLINWVDVYSWSPSEMMKVQIRDELMALGTSTHPAEIMSAIEKGVLTHYIERNPHDFDYLEFESGPSLLLILAMLLFSIILSTCVSIYFKEK